MLTITTTAIGNARIANAIRVHQFARVETAILSIGRAGDIGAIDQ